MSALQGGRPQVVMVSGQDLLDPAGVLCNEHKPCEKGSICDVADLLCYKCEFHCTPERGDSLSEECLQFCPEVYATRTPGTGAVASWPSTEPVAAHCENSSLVYVTIFVVVYAVVVTLLLICVVLCCLRRQASKTEKNITRSIECSSLLASKNSNSYFNSSMADCSSVDETEYSNRNKILTTSDVQNVQLKSDCPTRDQPDYKHYDKLQQQPEHEPFLRESGTQIETNPRHGDTKNNEISDSITGIKRPFTESVASLKSDIPNVNTDTQIQDTRTSDVRTTNAPNNCPYGYSHMHDLDESKESSQIPNVWKTSSQSQLANQSQRDKKIEVPSEAKCLRAGRVTEPEVVHDNTHPLQMRDSSSHSAAVQSGGSSPPREHEEAGSGSHALLSEKAKHEEASKSSPPVQHSPPKSIADVINMRPSTHVSSAPSDDTDLKTTKSLTVTSPQPSDSGGQDSCQTKPGFDPCETPYMQATPCGQSGSTFAGSKARTSHFSPLHSIQPSPTATRDNMKLREGASAEYYCQPTRDGSAAQAGTLPERSYHEQIASIDHRLEADGLMPQCSVHPHSSQNEEHRSPESVRYGTMSGRRDSRSTQQGGVLAEDLELIRQMEEHPDRHTFEAMKDFSWVQGFTSEGADIDVYVDSTRIDRYNALAELVAATKESPTKFNINMCD